MPFFLIESAYENEHEATERRLRTQAYHALLSGAAGQVFGNNPIWHFDGPGIYPAPVSWQEALDSRGAQSMTHFRNLLATMPWWLLEPDVDHTLLTEGLGPEDERAVAARTADGSFAIVYLPDRREITRRSGAARRAGRRGALVRPGRGAIRRGRRRAVPGDGTARVQPGACRTAPASTIGSLVLESPA